MYLSRRKKCYYVLNMFKPIKNKDKGQIEMTYVECGDRLA